MLGIDRDSSGRDVRFAVPEFTDLLRRSRIDQRLTQAVDEHRVTMLSAPSGYGKTVAVAEWVRGYGRPIAWLSLNRYDADPLALSSGLLATLRRTARTMDDADMLAELDVVNGAAIGALHAAVCSAARVADTPIVVVLDDLHFAGTRLTESVVCALVEQGPPNLRLVLVGRDPDQVPLAKRILGGDTVHITSETLLFTPEEIAAVAADFDWADVDLDALVAKTGGWAAAVRLAMLVFTGGRSDTRRKPSARTDDLLLSIIADDVLDTLPPDLAGFVLDTTTVSDLDEHLAVGLSGRPNALELLEQCRRRGLFLERFGDGDLPQYRWHNVFASRCRQLVALRDAAHSRELHRRAAELLAEHNPIRAIEEALVGGDPDLACRILVDSWTLLLAGRADESPDRVLARLPEPYATRPEILAITACAIDMAGRRSEGQALLASAEGDSAANRPSDPADQWRAELTDACARLFLSDERAELIEALGVAHENLAHARTLGPARYAAYQLLLGRSHMILRHDVPEGISLLKSAEWHATETGEKVLARRAAGFLAFSYSWIGDFTQAEAVLARIHDVDGYSDDWSTQIGVPELSAVGWTAYWRGDFDTARRAFGRCLDSRSEAASYRSIAGQYLAIIAAIDGDDRERRDALALVRQIPNTQVRGAPFELYRTVAFAKLAEAEGDFDRAGALVRGIRNDLREAPAAAVVAIDLIRRHVGKHAAAAAVKQMAPMTLSNYVRASLLVTSALIQRADGDYRAAHEVLERALDAAAPERIRRPFLEPDPALVDLLGEHGRWGSNHMAFLADLRVPPRAIDNLTDREQQILGYLRTAMTMTEIAAELSLSVNTIKTHTRSLYRKLGVQNRRDAVASAARKR